ncbi:transcription initiation factor TFIID subunit 2 [Pancytospora epiphaga]|nr:transcription initiation factor TFIID subunit 2 [Pancytospora epiphaga]
MKVKTQRNVYYVDITKRVFCGYVETLITRNATEQKIEYKCHHLEIEDIALLSESEIPSYLSNNTLVSSNGQQVLETEDCENDSQVFQHSKIEYFTDASKCTLTVKLPDGFDKLEFVIRISFIPTPSNPDLAWYEPVDENDKHRELVAYSSAPFDPSNWSSAIAPFVDVSTLFELVYAIPNKDEVRVASSGVFYAIKEEARNVIYSYQTTSHPANLTFAIGTYKQVDVFADSDMRRILSPPILADLSDIQSDLQSIIRFIESFTKTDALRSLSVVFTMTDTTIISNALDLIVIGAAHADGPTGIESAYRLKRILCDALAYNVFGFLGWDIVDSWIPVGMSGYLSDHAIRSLLGNNEFLYTYKEYKDYVIQNDVLEPPIFYTQRAPADYHSKFFRTKSRLVFHCLESHLSIAFIQKIAEEMISAKLSGTGNGITPRGSSIDTSFSARFFKIIKGATGKDLTAFFEMYVFLPGLLKIKLTLQLNKKKNLVRVSPTVRPTSQLQGCNKKYSGSVLLKTTEIEGTYDHDIILDGESSFVYHTRTKKKKKDEEEEVMALLFVRADPKREFLFDFFVEQPDYMYMEQLGEKNVIGQLEAVSALEGKAGVSTCEALERVLDNTHTFYKVRIKILYVLRRVSIEGYNGLQRLIQYFVRTRCVPNSTILKGNEFGLVNYFIQKHLVGAISQVDEGWVTCGSMEEERGAGETKVGRCKTIVSFLETALKFNDNSLSSFDDSWYIGMVLNNFSIQCVHLSRCGALDRDTLGHCVEEIERLRILDMVFPSNNNVVSRHCFISLIRLSYHGLVTLEREFITSLCKYPNLPSIRLVAIEGLMVLFGARIVDVLNIVKTDSFYFIYQVISVILKLLKLGTYRVVSGNGDYDDSESIAILNGLAEKFAGRVLLCSAIEEVILFINQGHIQSSEYAALLLKNFNFAKEENNRNTLLNLANKTKGLKLTGLHELRCVLLSVEGIIRIPKYPRKVPRVVSKLQLKIRLPFKRYVPKNVDGVIFRFKAPKVPVAYRRSDIPTFLVTRIIEHQNVGALEEFLRKTRRTAFFNWTPMLFKRIYETCSSNGYSFWDGPFSEVLLPYDDPRRLGADGYPRPNNTRTVYERIESSLVYILSYSAFKSKIYFAAKIVLNYLEKLVFQHGYIQRKVCVMNEWLRAECGEFIDTLIATEEYRAFVEPIDCNELKNYMDIIRTPVCFSEIRLSMPMYGSYDAFIVDLDRVAHNCLYYNHHESEIAGAAVRLRAKADEFKRSMLGKIHGGIGIGQGAVIECRDSDFVMKEILSQADVDGHISTIIEELPGIKTWGEFDARLAAVKKKYSRYSVNGKVCHDIVKDVRFRIRYWFSVESGRILFVND